jgi:hypothetical protein
MTGPSRTFGFAVAGCSAYLPGMFCVSETEASGVVLLPEQKAKMRASRLQRAYLEVLTRCDEWNRILRIAEHAKVKPNAGHDPSRAGAEL